MQIEEANIVEAIKTAKEYIQKISNVCKSCENRSNVFSWTKATDTDLQSIKEEIDKAYNLSLQKCTIGESKPQTYYDIDIFDLIRQFEVKFSREGWKVHRASRFGAGLIENQKEGLIYLIDGWNSNNPISLGQVTVKASSLTVRGKKITRKVFLAKHFSRSVIKEMEKGLKNTFLIDLGFIGKSTGNVTTYSNIKPEHCYPLITALLSFIEDYIRNPPKITERLDKAQYQLPMDTYMISSIKSLFKDYFHFSSCDHLQIGKKEPSFEEDRRKVPFEDRLRDAGLLYGLGRKNLEDLKAAYEDLLNQIDQPRQSEFVTIAIKKDVDGKICKNEIRLLCKSCEPQFLYRYEFLSFPCGGLNCVFKNFVDKLGNCLGFSTQYIEPYDLGLLQKDKHVIIISRSESVEHPADNIKMFSPNMIICIHNFLSEERIETSRYAQYRYRLREKDTTTKIAYSHSMNYLLPSIAYDWASDEYAFVPIEMKPPSMNEIIRTIISIDFTVGAAERAYKAPHDRIMDIYEEMGLEFGYKAVKEFNFGLDRVDVAWLERESEKPKVAIEVQLTGSITTDLWKLCELRPELAVLVVKGSYFQFALEHITRSTIIKGFNQRILLFDITEKNYILIEGGKLHAPFKETSSIAT